VRRFLPPFDPEAVRFRASKPMSQAVAVLGGGPYSYFRYEMHLAAQTALAVYDEAAAAFAGEFGRTHGALEAHRTGDADMVFVMMGSFATKAKDAVERLRAQGQPVGLMRLRLVRPFPVGEIRRCLAGKRAIAVIDQNLSMGKGGVLHAEVASALYGQPAPPVVASFVGGLGGRDITIEEFFEMARVTREAAERGRSLEPRLLYTESELREVRKLQEIAHVERREPGADE
jgi:pyruvate ferredoxin oxidoreductase alpha subunit